MAFDTHLLDEAIAAERARDEARRRAMLAEVLRQLDVVAPAHGIERAIVFGSVVKPGRYRAHSDVDIAVEDVDPVTFLAFKVAYELALGEEIDLVALEHCHFAHRIREQGVVWTATSSATRTTRRLIMPSCS